MAWYRATMPRIVIDRSQVGSQIGSQIGAFIACAAVFLAFASILASHPGFPLDDSWIHQTVARNLVETHVLGFLPGVRSSGSSSLLWTAVLAAGYASFRGLTPVLYSGGVSALLLGGIGLLLRRLAARDNWPPTEAWLLSLAPVLNGNFLWLGMIGMEHLLFVALSLAVIERWFADAGRWSLAGAAAGMALLALTRPEGVLLVGLLVLLRSAGRGWGARAVLAAGAGAGLGVSFAVNWAVTRTLLPLTMKGRQWLFFQNHTADGWRFAFERTAVRRLLDVWTVRPVDFDYSRLTAGAALLTLAALAALAGWALWRLARRGSARLLAVAMWAVALNATYLLMLPTWGHGGRYQPMTLLLMVPLLAAGVLHALRSLSLRAGAAATLANRVAVVGTTLLLAASAARSLSLWRGLTGNGIDQINQEHGAMAAWVASHVPPDDQRARRIAAFDIGRIGYGLHGSLVDLGGLTDAAYLHYLETHTVPRYLRERGIRYLVLPTDPRTPDKFLGQLMPGWAAAVDLRELETVCFPEAVALRVNEGTGAAMRCQSAYDLRFREPAGSGAAGPALPERPGATGPAL